MKILVSSLLLIVLFTTCKKYPEGGYHYNYLKHLRGNWKLQLFEVDGIDSTYLTQGNNYVPNYLNDFLRIATVHSGKRAEINWFSHSVNYAVYINNKGRDVIKLSSYTGPQLTQRNILTPTYDAYFAWKIEKLTETEMILISVSYNYKLKFIKN